MGCSKIAIIGAGAVGSTTAYSLMLSNCATEIVLIDVDKKRCKGNVLDLSDVISFCRTSRVYQGVSSDAKDADIIIIAAGNPQKPGQSRLELIEANKKIVSDIFKDIAPISRSSIVIMVTNPVDVLTLHAQRLSGLPRNQIIGSGTLLDTQRLRGRIAEKIGVAQQSINAYILGEHGDSQFPVWSSATVGDILLTDYPGITEEILDKIAAQARDAVYEIVACKGATYYGVASCITVLCKAILSDQKLIVPVSCYQSQFDVCLSMLVALGKRGIEFYMPTAFDEKEERLFKISIDKVKQSY